MFIALHTTDQAYWPNLSHNEARAWSEELNSGNTICMKIIKWRVATSSSSSNFVISKNSAKLVNETLELETEKRPRRLKFCSRRDLDETETIKIRSRDRLEAETSSLSQAIARIADRTVSQQTI